MEYVAEPIDRTAPWMRISLGMMRFACDTSELLADVIRRVGVIIAIVGAVVDAPSGTSETARETGHCRPVCAADSNAHQCWTSAVTARACSAALWHLRGGVLNRVELSARSVLIGWLDC